MLVSTVKAPADEAVERRSDRYAARHTLWDESSLRRVRSCGRAVTSRDGSVSVKVTTDAAGRRSAGFSGLQSCGSVWACPVCSAKVAAHRNSEISRALAAWVGGTGTGSRVEVRGRVALATFTMRHRKGQRLKSLWDALAKGWHAVASGRGWKTDQGLYGGARGRIPFIRVVEVTEGENGWHVHVHAILLLPAGATDESVQLLGARMLGRWTDALVSRGLSAPSARRGVDIRMLHGDPSAALGEYFTKAVYRASAEVSLGTVTKDPKHGNRTPFGILADLVRTGDADDLDTWHEWERASKGRRQIAWSRGLRAELLPDEAELSDEEAADLDAGGDVETSIDRSLWKVIQARREDYAVLRAFEESRRAGMAYLMARSRLADTADEGLWQTLKARGVPKGRRY